MSTTRPTSSGFGGLTEMGFRRGSVRARLMVWNVAAVAILLAALGVIVHYAVQAVLLRSVDHDLQEFGRGFGRARGSGRPGGRPGPTADRGPGRGRPEELRGPGEPPGPRDRGGRPPNDGGPGGPPPGPPPPGPGGFGPDRKPMTDAEIRRRAETEFWPRFLAANGVTVGPIRGLPPWDPVAFRQAFGGEAVFSTIRVNGQRVRVLSKPLSRGGPIDAVAQLPHALGDIDGAISSLNRTLLMLSPVALLLAGLGGWAVTGRALRPVRRIADAAERIGAQDLSMRLDLRGSDEFAQLAGTIDGMLGRLEDAFKEQADLVLRLEHLLEQQRRFTADASHELKTPLAVIKVHTGLLRQAPPTPEEYTESIQDIEAAADRMSRLVQDLLILARHDAGLLGRDAIEVPIRDVLSQARSSLASAEAPDIALSGIDPSLTVYGNESELVRLFTNLLDNAVRHTPPTGRVQAAAAIRNGCIAVDVNDTGEGIAPEHVPHLGERFYRADASRARGDGGSGLGLSICKSIVEAHGGTIQFESELGRGTTVHVELPRSR